MDTLPDDNKPPGERLAALLKGRGITQAAFATSIGIAQASLSNLCAGKFQPDLTLAQRIETETGGVIAVLSWPKFATLAQALGTENHRGAA